MPAASFSAQNIPQIHLPASFGNRENRFFHAKRTESLRASISTPPDNIDLRETNQSSGDEFISKIAELKFRLMTNLQQRDYEAALNDIQQFCAGVTKQLSYQESERLTDLVQSYLNHVLNKDAMKCYQALQLQFSLSKLMATPFHQVPKRTLLDMIKALTSTEYNKNTLQQRQLSNAAYRLLQRLVTGKQVRARQQYPLYDVDWNRVLGAFCKDGRVDRAYQLIAWRSKLKEQPALSAVTFSILLRGHGLLGQQQQVLRVWEHALEYGIVPDIVMVNTLLNAFVESNDILGARKFFEQIRSRYVGGFFREVPPYANARTYNTMLKGLANAGLVDDAIKLGKEMDDQRFWDFVTTNTMVHAAIITENYELAESMLGARTIVHKSPGRHPNVDAYTGLLDAYAKSDQLDKAVATLKTMRQRKVDATEITYTCLIAGFGRNNKIGQALKMIDFMSSTGIKPSCAVYNALISALVEDSTSDHNGSDGNVPFDTRVDQALKILKNMVQAGVKPDAITVSTLVAALGKCSSPRVDAAKLLVRGLGDQMLLPAGDVQVVTALVKTCGAGGDFAGAVDAFKTLQTVDAVSINVLLDVCCRCGDDRMVSDTFDRYFLRNKGLQPDVVSYTILIDSLLKRETATSVSKAYTKYLSMKTRSNILPDRTLVDIVLKALVRIGRSRSLSKNEAYFITDVLKDAGKLEWEMSQLQQRRRAVRSVLGENHREVWRRDKEMQGMLQPEDDELFRRKGWNQVNSSFRVWGALADTRQASDDEFLKSKRWNRMESGFRIL
jgi:leucine-rich PPR motif-containing protein